LIEAILLIGDRLVNIFKTEQPLEYLRFYVSMMAQPIDFTSTANFDVSATASTVFCQNIIFRLSRRIGYNRYEYQYDHVETNEKFRVSIQENVQFLREPNEKINLNILRQRFRSKEKMTELLLRYYRS